MNKKQLLAILIVASFLGLAYAKEDYKPVERTYTPPARQRFNRSLINDYSFKKSTDFHTEPASNLTILPDPARAAQYETSLHNQATTNAYREKTSPKASVPNPSRAAQQHKANVYSQTMTNPEVQDSSDYDLDVSKYPLFDSGNKDSQANHPHRRNQR